MSITYNSNQLNALADLSKESADIVLVELIIDSCRDAALQGLYSTRHYGTFSYSDGSILSLLELGYSLNIHAPQEEVLSTDTFDQYLNYYTLDSSDYVEVNISTGADVTHYYTFTSPNYNAATGVAIEGTTYYAKVDNYTEISDIDGFYKANSYYIASGNNYNLDTEESLSAVAHYTITAVVYAGTYAASTYYYLSGNNYILDTAAAATEGRVYYKLISDSVTLYDYSDLYVIKSSNNAYVEVEWEN